jgi:uncharacterized coiled-coil protein SlyX
MDAQKNGAFQDDLPTLLAKVIDQQIYIRKMQAEIERLQRMIDDLQNKSVPRPANSN